MAEGDFWEGSFCNIPFDEDGQVHCLQEFWSIYFDEILNEVGKMDIIVKQFLVLPGKDYYDIIKHIIF